MATAFAFALATPALAAEFYVALNTATNQCQVVAQKPDGMALKMVGAGAYDTQAEAQQAIRSLAECNS
jgi:hypothetical protein